MARRQIALAMERERFYDERVGLAVAGVESLGNPENE
jgi:hypothetical protein